MQLQKLQIAQMHFLIPLIACNNYTIK